MRKLPFQSSLSLNSVVRCRCQPLQPIFQNRSMFRIHASMTLPTYSERVQKWWMRPTVLHVQWRMQKIFMGGFHSVAYGGLLYLMCAVCDVTVGRHISCFQTKVLATFVDIICIFVYMHSLNLCQWTEYKLSALQVRISEENTLNATTHQFITAKNIRLRVETGE